MILSHIDLGKLSVSSTNMRSGRKAPDVADILPSVRARRVLVPILIRLTGDSMSRSRDGEVAPQDTGDATFEIVAGRRRYVAAMIVADERRSSGGDIEPMPCAIIEAGDDAAALEASLIENVARLDPDEVTRWETFAALVRKGRSLDDLSATFGLPPLVIRRTLALGNLLPRLRTLYRGGEIDGSTVRHLTMASKAQQKAWLMLRDDPDAYCPSGHQLKAWLFGGQSIAVRHALFDVAASGLATIADLFGEDAYFADADGFWTAQHAAIEARTTAYVEAGWSDVVVVPASEHFAAWEYEKTPKRKGGRVYADVRATGEVVFHEGYVSRAEARRVPKGEGDAADRKATRPEVTATMQTYIDLHRHAAVRAALTRHPGVALRLMVAHAIVGSPFWRVSPEPQATRNEDVRESVISCVAEPDFDVRRRAVLGVLNLPDDEPTVSGGGAHDLTGDRLSALLFRLLDLPDAVILEIVTIVMGETLAAGSAVVEAVGLQIGVDLGGVWQADDVFFALIRDREVMQRIVAEGAGDGIARANANEPAKVLKRIVRDHLDGTDGRSKVERWVPRWMTFPPSAYTTRGGVGTVAAHAKAEAARGVAPRPDPDGPAPLVLAVPKPEPSGSDVSLPLAA